MYAVFQVGQNQYQVREGDCLRLEKVMAEVGQKVQFDQVLMAKADNAAPKIGQPFLKDVIVEAEVIGQYRGQKVLVFNFKRRKGFHKSRGHRQSYTSLKILKISA